MLKKLGKRKTAKKVLWTLAIIIIPAFILWGSGSIIREKRQTGFAGKIFGRKISSAKYKDSFQAVRNQAKLRYGDNLIKIEKYLGLPQQTWDRLILLYEADRRKIKIQDEEVITAIENMSVFKKNNEFSQEIYNYILERYLRITARTFEENQRDSLRIIKLYEAITDNVFVDEKGVEDEYKKQNEQVKVAYIAILPEKYRNQETINDEEIKNYFENNKQTFLHPISVNIEYIGFDYPLKLQEKDRQEIKNKFMALSQKIKKPADFEKISKDKHLAIKETGFFFPEQPIPQIGWSKGFSEASFSLTEKEISQPVDTLKGIYILRLKDKREAYIPEINEVKEQIAKILDEKKALLTAKKNTEEILLKLKEKQNEKPQANLTSLARKLGLTVKETPLFRRNTYIEGVGISKEFSDVAFGLKENEISGIIETGKAFYILKLVQFVGIDEEKFRKEREEFRNKLLHQEKQEMFGRFLQELRNKAQLINNIGQDYNLNYR